MAGYSLSFVGNVAVVLSIEPPSKALVEEVAGQIRAHAARVGTVGTIMLIRPDRPLVSLDDATKQALRRAFDEARSYSAATLIVYEREGFAAAAMRAMLAGVLFFAAGALPIKVVASWRDGAAWLLGKLADARLSVSRDELDRAIAALPPGKS